jgi:multidrug resistance efflux pump
MEQRSITKMYLKTNTEKIAWIGDNIRACLLAIEKANKMKAKAKEDIKRYEELVKTVLVTRRKEDEQT